MKVLFSITVLTQQNKMIHTEALTEVHYRVQFMGTDYCEMYTYSAHKLQGHARWTSQLHIQNIEQQKRDTRDLFPQVCGYIKLCSDTYN